MASDQATIGPYRFRRASAGYDSVRIAVYGSTWAGTVTLQTSDPDQQAYVDEAEWTGNGAASFTPGGDCDIRMIFTRTSGTVFGSIVSNA